MEKISLEYLKNQPLFPHECSYVMDVSNSRVLFDNQVIEKLEFAPKFQDILDIVHQEDADYVRNIMSTTVELFQNFGPDLDNHILHLVYRVMNRKNEVKWVNHWMFLFWDVDSEYKRVAFNRIQFEYPVILGKMGLSFQLLDQKGENGIYHSTLELMLQKDLSEDIDSADFREAAFQGLPIPKKIRKKIEEELERFEDIEDKKNGE